MRNHILGIEAAIPTASRREWAMHSRMASAVGFALVVVTLAVPSVVRAQTTPSKPVKGFISANAGIVQPNGGSLRKPPSSPTG
jgi:hypothetical protein